MARDLETIEQEIETAKSGYSSLDEITTSESVGVWTQIKKVIAFAHWILESLFDSKKEELEALALAAVAGSPSWYQTRVLGFQYGYELTVVDGALVYLVEDLDAQIVSQASIQTEEGKLIIKVAKEVSDELVKLSDDERIALDSYISDVKFAGTNHELISTDPDEVFIDMTIYYDGKLILTDFKVLVEAAINEYLRSVGFDGIFRRNKLRDAIEAVSGVEDTYFNALKIKPSGGSYLNVPVEYNPASGYYIIDTSKPLSGINYVAR